MNVPYNVKIEKNPQNSEGLIDYDLTEALIKCCTCAFAVTEGYNHEIKASYI